VTALRPLPLPTCYLHLQLLLPGRRRTCSVHTHTNKPKKKSHFFLQPEADFRHSTLAKMLAEGCDGAGRLSSVNCGVSSDGIPSVFAESCSVPSPRTCTVIDRLFFAGQSMHCIAGRSPVLETSAGLALVHRIKSNASLSLVTVAGSFGPDRDLSCRWGSHRGVILFSLNTGHAQTLMDKSKYSWTRASSRDSKID